MKEQSQHLPCHISTGGGYRTGSVFIIGAQPEHEPYVVVHDSEGKQVAVIDEKEMNQLVRHWQKRQGK